MHLVFIKVGIYVVIMQSELAQIYEPHFIYLALISFCGCLAIIAAARYFPRLQGRASDADAVQSMHSKLTPRVGGMAIFGALGCSVFFSPVPLTPGYFGFFTAMSVMFFVGLREDLGFEVTPKVRLMVIVGASLLVVVLVGEWLPRIGVTYLDQWLQYWIFGVPFTLLVTAGVANGFNLIDGVNGLAGLTATTAAVALALIAFQSDYFPMANVCMMFATVIFGFFLVNYPFGLIFLGDAGAYTIGFVLVWLGIAIIVNQPEVSPWAVLLTLFWPLADTLLAIFRRTRRDKGAMLPDRLHVHQLVMRGLEICILGRGRRHVSNPLTTLLLAPFVIAPQIVGVLLFDNNRIAFFSVVGFLTIFFASYIVLVGFVPRHRRRVTT